MTLPKLVTELRAAFFPGAILGRASGYCSQVREIDVPVLMRPHRLMEAPFPFSKHFDSSDRVVRLASARGTHVVLDDRVPLLRVDPVIERHPGVVLVGLPISRLPVEKLAASDADPADESAVARVVGNPAAGQSSFSIFAFSSCSLPSSRLSADVHDVVPCRASKQHACQRAPQVRLLRPAV